MSKKASPIINRGCQNGAFGKRSFCLGDTRHFLIFVDFRGPRSKILCFCGYQNFRRFLSKPPLFSRRQQHRFPTRPFRQSCINTLFLQNWGFCAHLFSRAREKGFSFFFLWGDPFQNRPQNRAPGGCLFSTRESRSEVPERGDLGKKIAWEKGWVDKAKKKEKRMRKERWV